MDEILKDPRFAHTLNDPRFREPRVKYTKTKIDSRFKRMLNDKEFTDKYTVDKRGRPINTSAKEKLDRLYDYESEAEQSSSSDDSEERKTESEVRNSSKRNKESDEEDTDDDVAAHPESDRPDHSFSDTDSDASKLKVDGPDYARGAALLESSDEEEATGEGDGEDDDLDLDEDLLDHHWNELDHDAPTTEESTNRLALCCMDWDRIKAKDIYVLCSSFVPPGGAVQSVTIYPSEEGLQRMAEEARLGPCEFQKLQEEGELGSEDKGRRSKARDQAILRKYQLQRLNYYYAVIVCDSADSADKIYQECNGMEYEKSANRIDLRFIPEHTTFDQEPRETCTGIADMSNFQPTTYRTTALCQDKVDLTWDETCIDRLKKTMKTFTPEDCENNEGAEFIASSESSSDKELSDGENSPNNGARKTDCKKKKKWAENLRQSLNLKAGTDTSKQKKKKKQKKTSTAAEQHGVSSSDNMENGVSTTSDKGSKKKSKKLKNKNKNKSSSNESELSNKGSKDIDKSEGLEENSSSDEEGGMEYTWQLSARDKGKNKSKEKLTPWETYQQKKKDKKKEKKKKRKLDKLTEQGVDISNDLGFHDPFFDEEPETDKKKTKKKNKKKDALRKRADDEEDDEESRKEKATLSLLVSDGHSHSRGFNLLQLMKEEKAREKQKGKKRKQAQGQANPDDFQFTLDDRFSSLFTDPDLHINPNAPEFKKTKGMVTVVEEISKKKRQKAL